MRYAERMARWRPHDEPGLGMAAFTALLFCGGALGLLGLVWSVWTLTSDSQRLRHLHTAGILAAGDRVEALWDISPHGDASMGCLVSEGRLIRWHATTELGRVTLLGAEMVFDADLLTVRDAQAQVSCPLGNSPFVAPFVKLVQERLTEAPPPRPMWEIRDPRLREHFDLSDTDVGIERPAY